MKACTCGCGEPVKPGRRYVRGHNWRSSPGPARCGTYAGWNAHQHKGETPCPDCRAAATAYMRAYRATNDDYRARNATENAARSRALWRLAERYPGQFRRFVEEEMGR